MFSKLAVAASVFLVASAGPVPEKRTVKNVHGGGAVPFVGQLPANVPFHGSFANPFQHVSLNGWGGFQNLNQFDNFFGVNDFSGIHPISNLVVKQQPQLVCKSIPVHIIQQQLLVLREYMKKLVTTQICEVEVQTIVFSQFQAGIFDFGQDLRHVSGRPLGFDQHIANQIVNLHDINGGILGKDFGFNGKQFGQDFVLPGGFNWNDNTSPITINNAFGAAQQAFLGGNAFTAPVPGSPIPGLIVPPSPGIASTVTSAIPPLDTALLAPPPVNTVAPLAPPPLVTEPQIGFPSNVTSTEQVTDPLLDPAGVPANAAAAIPPPPPAAAPLNLAIPVSGGAADGGDSSSADPNPASD